MKQRMTREESRDQTRLHLLQATQTLLARKALADCSVEEIAAEAGYSRGAFYSNFADKASLLLALLKHEQARIVQELEAVFEVKAPGMDFEQTLMAYYANAYSEGGCFLAWMEARLLAIRDLTFRRQLHGEIVEMQGIIARFVTTYRKRTGLVSKIPAAQMAIGLTALCDGLQFAHMADPQTVSNADAHAIMQHYFEAILRAHGKAP